MNLLKEIFMQKMFHMRAENSVKFQPRKIKTERCAFFSGTISKTKKIDICEKLLKSIEYLLLY